MKGAWGKSQKACTRGETSLFEESWSEDLKGSEKEPGEGRVEQGRLIVQHMQKIAEAEKCVGHKESKKAKISEITESGKEE